MSPKIIIPSLFKSTLESSTHQSFFIFYGGVLYETDQIIISAFTTFNASCPPIDFSIQASPLTSVMGYISQTRNKEFENAHQGSLKFYLEAGSALKATDISLEGGAELEIVYTNKQIQKVLERRIFLINKWSEEWVINRTNGEKLQVDQESSEDIELISISQNKKAIVPPQRINSKIVERLIAYIDKSVLFKKGVEGGFTAVTPSCLHLNTYKLTRASGFPFGLLRSNKEYALRTALYSSITECQNYEALNQTVIKSALDKKKSEEQKYKEESYQFVFSYSENSLVPLKVKFSCDQNSLAQQFLLCCKSLGMLESQAKALMQTEIHLGERESPFDLKIINPHIEVMGGQDESERYMTRGFYEYFHYKQDGEKDEGWGCAYRSLQTIVSWFCLQNLSSNRVPTIREIQQVLVECGAKKEKLIGSKDWIGSIEVMSFLSEYIGIESKILSVPQGAKVNEHLPILKDHFKRQGTPIMIGGGVLAYTLLGVEIAEDDPNATRFLILDPHYTGLDRNVKEICGKGWCSWKKGAAVFKKSEFYNFCLPQCPK